ncbi:hypothetical protein Tco_0635493 [Tanacetum coccineum]
MLHKPHIKQQQPDFPNQTPRSSCSSVQKGDDTLDTLINMSFLTAVVTCSGDKTTFMLLEQHGKIQPGAVDSNTLGNNDRKKLHFWQFQDFMDIQTSSDVITHQCCLFKPMIWMAYDYVVDELNSADCSYVRILSRWLRWPH